MRYQSNRPKRQFLAGVKCTQCGHLDTTVQVQIFEPAFDEYIECVHCQHSERRPTADDLATMHEQSSSESIGFVKFL